MGCWYCSTDVVKVTHRLQGTRELDNTSKWNIHRKHQLQEGSAIYVTKMLMWRLVGASGSLCTWPASYKDITTRCPPYSPAVAVCSQGTGAHGPLTLSPAVAVRLW